VSLRAALPWLCALIALPFALLALAATSPVACDEIPSAFSPEVTTEQSDLLVVFASRCEVTSVSDGSTISNTEFNWIGLVLAASFCLGAWLFGATLCRRISPLRGLAGLIACGLAAGVAFLAL
jgi:hypothetical protein